MREDGEGGVAVPGVVAADLVVVQAGLVLRALEALLDGPAATAPKVLAAASSRSRSRRSAVSWHT